MIGNKLEQSIIGVFEENLCETFSINNISKKIKKSYPNINKKIHYFIKEGILGKINIGNSYQCYLNLKNDKAKIFLAINELNKKDKLLEKNPEIKNIIQEINNLIKLFKIDCVVIHKKNLFLIFRTKIQKDLSEYTFLTKEYNILVVSKEEFQKKFLEDSDLRKYHYVLANVENYINIIAEINPFLLKIRTESSISENIQQEFADKTNNKNIDKKIKKSKKNE